MEGALSLAARGVPVVPLRPRSKIPIHSNWPKLGLLDPDAIRIEWQLNPDSNVGVLCGHQAFGGQGLTIVDIDMPDGWDTLNELDPVFWPHSVAFGVDTPNGGRHLYFKGAVASWNPGPGVEVRSVGRMCAAPPSAIAEGGITGDWTGSPRRYAGCCRATSR
jgi:hypothetical protein